MTSGSGRSPIVVAPFAPAVLDMSGGWCRAAVPWGKDAPQRPHLLDMSGRYSWRTEAPGTTAPEHPGIATQRARSARHVERRWVTRPVRGVIDLVLEPADGREPLVATEAQSELRRLERQIRWAKAKAAALEQARVRPVSRLLLLRNTRRTRAVVAEHARSMAIAYSAPAAAAYAALTGDLPWPGPALLWVDVMRGRARIRSTPPRSITVGR